MLHGILRRLYGISMLFHFPKRFSLHIPTSRLEGIAVFPIFPLDMSAILCMLAFT